MSFTFSKSSQCLLHFFVAIRDGPNRCAVNWEACNPLVDEAFSLADMTFSTMNSIKISSMYFSTALRSLEIHTHDKMFWVGGKMLKVIRMGGEVSISIA
jgi:hypothetical protein